MARMNFDDEGLLDEPCLSCEKSYIEDIWGECCCDEKECFYKGDKMTKEQKDKILKALAEDRNNYARDCGRRIATEYGKITGADYMLQRIFDILRTEEVESQESEDNNE